MVDDPTEEDESEMGGALGLLQGDLAINLFMIFLAILAMLALLAAAAGQSSFRVAMQTEPAEPEALVRGWAPVQPLLPRVVVRADGIALLDRARLADAMATGVSLGDWDRSGPIRDDRDPQAYRVTAMLRDGLPDAMAAWRLPVEMLPQAGPWPAEWQALLAAGSAVDLAVYPGGEAFAQAAAARLHAERLPFRLLFQSREMVNFGRITRHFDFEDTYK